MNTRLQPIEKFIGPVAALPRATSVTTSPPEPIMQPRERPAATAPAQVAPAAPPPAPAAQAPEAPAPETPAPEAIPAEAAAPDPEPDEIARLAASDETATTESALQDAPAEAAEAPPSAEAQPLTAMRMEDVPEASDTAAAAPPPAEAPAPPPEAMETAALDPVALPPAANDGTTRYGIEIGTVAAQDGLRPLWREFLTNHAALVAGLQPRRVLAPDKKWRLVAGPFANAEEAAAACTLFKKAERPCAPTVYAGDSL
jgi:SPOR domain